ncbi:polysaccharide biosynthesis protein [Flavobacterium covae]|uniref:Polysaccharide biosynthesis protein n=2 Tax=Flavobacterium TaxID=237 RepID=A0AA94JMX3_9FLAO|nr:MULTISPECIES: oligosaccharide flippase family protein [Flavobacterium]AND64126.1 polysaccharide biosynthesis protein [Flavobacterium covae]MCH4829660.1 oligosaccharide flippase family protein [Flavobacterium columnare]MCH4831343.1 oligosaccharide flippase family protein [Flavobacterium columnare]OWP82125.1 polysaccharide biosynthesis protein [Flavobacterium covae]OWP87375.1 polysaccharide biosynthesis protein [Flavobacterium covae]
MGIYKSLFKQTLIYGLATVLPRMISFLLNPLYVKKLPKAEFADVSIIFAYLIFFNVVLSYGMETAFFRFYSQEENKKNVFKTSLASLFWSSIAFLAFSLIFRESIAHFINIKKEYITYTIWILVLDALVVIPFSKLRAEKKSMQYAVIKILNVVINFGLNIFFLLILPLISKENPISTLYFDHFQVGYIFISNVLASLFTLVMLSKHYIKREGVFDKKLWVKMIQYGLPILFSGIGFAINEHFDKILLEKLHVSKADIGAYSACYKLGMFMVLFRTAYSLGIEPFFFNHAKNENAPQTYATITKYFVISGSFILLFVIVFIDLLKQPLVPNETYWEAIKVVPLIVLANFFLGIYTNLSVWYKLTDKTYIGTIISLIGAILTLIFNYWLIPVMSYYGSALATIIAYGSMMFISYYLGQKKYPIPYETTKIVSYIGMSITLSILSFYVPILRNNYIFGIFALIAFGYYIYQNEKNIFLKIIKRK